MITLTQELTSRLVGKQPDEIKAALFKEGGEELKENAEDTFYNWILDKFKEAERDKVKSEVGRAIKKQAEAFEKAAKPIFERFEIKTASLEDGLKELSEKIPGSAGTPGDPKELTIEDLRKLPAYQSALDEDLAKSKEKTQEWEQKYNDYTKQVEREKVLSVSRDQALSLLDGKNAVWGEDKLAQLDYFFRAVGTDALSLDESKKPILVDGDGNPLRDDSRNKVTFENWILNNWKKAGYTFHDAPPGSGSAGAGQGGGQGGGGSKIIINSVQHYENLMRDAGLDLKKQANIMDAFAEWSKTNPIQ